VRSPALAFSLLEILIGKKLPIIDEPLRDVAVGSTACEKDDMVERDKSGRWMPGASACPGGGGRLDRMVVFDLRQAARKHCPEAIQVIAAALKHKDARVRLIAADLMLSRGYGKPEVMAEVIHNHKFAQVPEVMSKSDWLACRGDPELLAEMKRRCPDAPGEILDLKAEKDSGPKKH
jgi:hypothetical protein